MEKVNLEVGKKYLNIYGDVATITSVFKDTGFVNKRLFLGYIDQGIVKLHVAWNPDGTSNAVTVDKLTVELVEEV